LLYFLDLVPRATFTLLSDMDAGRSRERLLIGEVAELLGVIPKAIRHYDKLVLAE